MQLFKKFFLQQADLAESPVAVIELLLEQLPRTPLAQVQADLAARTGHAVTAEVEQDWTDHEHLLCTLTFGAHSLEVAALARPLPGEVMARTVELSPWGGDFRARCVAHTAYVIVRYSGALQDGIAQLTACYQAAAALTHASGAIAVVNEPAWTAHPGHFVTQLVAPDMLPVLPESPPLPFWTGLLRLDAAGEPIFLTRGFHRFGLPDLALQGYSHDRAREAHELLHDLFHYLHYENRDVHPGDFLTIDAVGYLAFFDGTEYQQLFGGVANILIVRPSTADELSTVAE